MATDTHQNESSTAALPQESYRALVAVPDRHSQLPAVQWPTAVTATRPEILTARPTPQDLLHALRRRWLLALGLGMVFAGVLAAMVWVLVPIRYEASALIRVSKVRPTVFENVSGGAEEFETYKRTQQQLIKSNFVLSRAARKPELVKLRLIQQNSTDPAGYLDSQLLIEYPGDAELLKVAMKGDRRDELPIIINAVVDAYMDEIVNAERNERLKQRDTLERSYGKYREEIRKKLNGFNQLAKQLGTNSSETAVLKKKLALQHLDGLITSRNILANQLREQDMKLLLLKTRQAKPQEGAQLPDYLFDAEMNKDPIIAQATARIPELRRAIKAQVGLSKDGRHSGIARLKQQLADLEEEVETRKHELRPQLIEQLGTRGDISGLGYALPLLETEREAMAKNLEQINGELTKHVEEVQKLEANSSELDARKSELDELQSITGRMGIQLKLWNVELEAAPRITVVEKASRPQTNDAVRKYVGVGMAAILGFGVVLFGVAYLEFQGRRINSSGEVKDGLGLAVVGELPTLSGRSWRKIQSGGAAGTSLQLMLNESIDSIRATLIHTASVESPRMIMVCSADPQEGKTTVATQLAASLARSGRRTLLIDADVRHPAAHRVFELPLESGLCEVLRGEVDREAAIQPTQAANLWLLPAGRCCMTSVQALSHKALADLLTAVKGEFDFVIIDSGPVLKVADPLLVGQHVDAAVISVLRDISRVPQVYEAVDRLRSVGITVLGAVVNGVNDRSGHYRNEMVLAGSQPAETAK